MERQTELDFVILSVVTLGYTILIPTQLLLLLIKQRYVFSEEATTTNFNTTGYRTYDLHTREEYSRYITEMVTEK